MNHTEHRDIFAAMEAELPSPWMDVHDEHSPNFRLSIYAGRLHLRVFCAESIEWRAIILPNSVCWANRSKSRVS